MNSQFKVKLLNHLAKKKNNKGFTLIELLVVVIIIGVLAAIALPNLLNQVAKGRQAEAKTELGALNRAQQAYRLEKATFTKIDNLPVKVSPIYYDITGAAADSKTFYEMKAAANTQYNNDIKDYSAGVAQDAAGKFTAKICEADAPTTTYAAAAVDATEGVKCGTNFEAIQ